MMIDIVARGIAAKALRVGAPTDQQIMDALSILADDGKITTGATAAEAAQIEQNTADISSLSDENAELKGDLAQLDTGKIDKPTTANNNKIPRAKDGEIEWVEVGQPTDAQTESAVNNWLNEHPEVTTTVQDGAITEPKIHADFLPYIKNSYVTPEMFGAVGDGVTDDTAAIQNAIDTGEVVYISKKTYDISNSLVLSGNKTLIVDGELNYSGSEYAILISNSYNTLRLNNVLKCPSGGGVKLCSDGTDCGHNLLFINQIVSFYACLYYQAISRHIVYNICHFNRLLCQNNTVNSTIEIYGKDSAAVVGENTFYGGKCEKGLYGMYCDGGEEYRAINAVKAYNICYEGVTNCHYIKNVETSIFDYPRFAECVRNGLFLKLVGDARDNVFTGSYFVPLVSIDFSECTNLRSAKHFNRLNMPVGKTYTSAIHGKSALVDSEGFIVTPIHKKLFQNITKDLELPDTGPVPSFFIVNKENAVLKLSSSYGSMGVNEIIVRQTSSSTKYVTIYDKKDNLVFDGSQYAGKTVRLICYYFNSETDTWIVETIS